MPGNLSKMVSHASGRPVALQSRPANAADNSVTAGRVRRIYLLLMVSVCKPLTSNKTKVKKRSLTLLTWQPQIGRHSRQCTNRFIVESVQD